MDPSGDNMYRRMIRHKNFKPVSPFITEPPLQSSPLHILNALNDKCIQIVLSYLIGDIRDFYSAAQVCRKFQENAKICYPSIYKDFYVGILDYHLPLNETKNFLSIFGHLIQSITWEYNEKVYDSEIFNAITEFCGNNLLGLKIRRRNIDFFEVLKFKVLELLYVCECNIDNFKIPPTLKKLKLVGFTNIKGISWLSETHPHLIEVCFTYFEPLNDTNVIEFQALNPQLEIFVAKGCDLTTSILQGIATRVPNLIELGFNVKRNACDEIALQRNFEADIKHLSGLKCLKRLDIPFYLHPMASPLIINVLVDNDIPIEDIQWIDGKNPRIVESLANLKTLQKLVLRGFTCDMVIDLVMKVPNLTDLNIIRSHISLNGLKLILEHARNLKSLDIHDDVMLVDSDSLMESILDLARGRVKVKLHIDQSKVFLKNPDIYYYQIYDYKNSKWLAIIM